MSTQEPSAERVTWQQACDAIDSLDDFARMMVGVDPSGPRELLYRFVEQQKQAADAAAPQAAPTRAASDVLAERQRQISVEGWTPEHDDEHSTGAMAAAAACYALWACVPDAENAYWYAAREEAARHLWPWDHDWWKPGERRRALIKAGALILAEIERLDRADTASRSAAAAPWLR